MELEIYNYYSAVEFLIDAFENKKASNPKFSVRAWARHLGLKSHTQLLAILSRKKKVPISYFKTVSKNMGLQKEEEYFLLLLINLDASEDQFSRMMLLDRIEFIKKHKKLKMKELANFEILSDPFFGALLEMTNLKNFQFNTEYIQKITRFSKSRSEIEKAIQKLLDFGFLSIIDGKLVKSQEHITNVHDLANIGSLKYLRNSALLAAEQIGQQKVEAREFNGYALNVRSSDMGKMKVAIRGFIRDFIIQFEAPAYEGDSTYQFNIQLFDLVRKT